MGLINVYCRSPISHKFSLIENGFEKEYVIEGMNKHQVIIESELAKNLPKTTQIEEKTFDAIAQKYKAHLNLFGGKDLEGRIIQPLIYKAKDVDESKKMMDDFKPAITEKEMATKTKGVQKMPHPTV